MNKKRPLVGLKPGDLRVLGLGLELAAAIGGLGWIGNWADEHWHTSPCFLISGIALGTVGGCWNVFKAAEKDGFFKKKKKPARDAGTDTRPDAGQHIQQDTEQATKQDTGGAPSKPPSPSPSNPPPPSA